MNAVAPRRSTSPPAAAAVELVRLRILSPTFGIASARIAGIHLRCIAVTMRPDGSMAIKPPRIISRNGAADYGLAFALPPHALAAIEAAIGMVWDRARKAGSDGA